MLLRGLGAWWLLLLVLAALLAAFLLVFMPSRGSGGLYAATYVTSWGNVTAVPFWRYSLPSVKLYVLVDNNGWDGFRSAWGLSILVETRYGSVLFDTGPDPGVLEYNAKRLGVDLCSVKAIVISHEHMDHVGGLPYFAKHCPGIRIYVPRGIDGNTLAWIKGLGLRDIAIVNNTMTIMPGVFVLSRSGGLPARSP